jgi:RNA polymerase sigma-70 factor (family 1)
MPKYQLYSDQELAALLKSGNQHAFDILYDRYKAILHVHAYKKLGNLQEAQDLIQELFIYIWQKRAGLPDTKNFSGYLYMAMRNRILDVISHRRVESKYLDSLSNFISEDNFITDIHVRENELKHRIESAIAELPPKMREVFVLSRTTAMSHKEIADELGIAESTVKNHIKAALKQLRSKLGLFLYIILLLKF